ncbi:FR47-like protein [Clostridium cavendishii DSM 21758]|uniref:FR47-like protein n=1 Tax=Clostridium cavendishii DSM 21758 TaxID=1121302 RepID=A0A1M6T5R5_9CLOT|nr:GNAT family N-acetyltransferase [Clostridium cavendishii]SHK52321.1 FR47-like protein [Clostridium cavendishii DSM 21758]
MHNKDEIIRLLLKDEIKNINLINFIKNCKDSKVYREGDSVLVRATTDQNWVYITSESYEEFIDLLKYVEKEDKAFFLTDEWMAEYITLNSNVEWTLPCMKLYIPMEKKLDECNFNMRKLTLKDSEYIFENYEYAKYTSFDYLKDRIENGLSLAIEEDNKIVGFSITHDDGAMGFMTVLKEYRRKNYAYYITVAMARKIREKGNLPFAHIEESNEKSMNLALKSGFEKYKMIYIVKLI